MEGEGKNGNLLKKSQYWSIAESFMAPDKALFEKKFEMEEESSHLELSIDSNCLHI